MGTSYVRPEMIDMGSNTDTLVILGALADGSDIRVGFHNYPDATHFYYDLGFSANSEVRGLYYNSALH